MGNPFESGVDLKTTAKEDLSSTAGIFVWLYEQKTQLPADTPPPIAYPAAVLDIQTGQVSNKLSDTASNDLADTLEVIKKSLKVYNTTGTTTADKTAKVTLYQAKIDDFQIRLNQEVNDKRENLIIRFKELLDTPNKKFHDLIKKYVVDIKKLKSSNESEPEIKAAEQQFANAIKPLLPTDSSLDDFSKELKSYVEKVNRLQAQLNELHVDILEKIPKEKKAGLEPKKFEPGGLTNV